jgi:hypothetical protein
VLLVHFDTALHEWLGHVRLGDVGGRLLVRPVALCGCFLCRVGVGVALLGVELLFGVPLVVLVRGMPQFGQ